MTNDPSSHPNLHRFLKVAFYPSVEIHVGLTHSMSPAFTVLTINIEYWMNGYWMNNECWFNTQHVTGFDSVDDEYWILDEYWMNGYWMNNEYWFYTQHVTGFDSVDDESKPENAMFDSEVATPDRWSMLQLCQIKGEES